MKITQTFENAIQFGKEIKISPKSLAISNKPGLVLKMADPCITVEISLGEEKGILILSDKAYSELKKGTKPKIKTHKQFKKG